MAPVTFFTYKYTDAGVCPELDDANTDIVRGYDHPDLLVWMSVSLPQDCGRQRDEYTTEMCVPFLTNHHKQALL